MWAWPLVIYQKPDEHWARPVLAGITLVLRILAVVSLFTSVIIVINTTTAVITQQTDQIGVIKAIGGRTGTIMQVYLAGVLVYGHPGPGHRPAAGHDHRFLRCAPAVNAVQH